MEKSTQQPHLEEQNRKDNLYLHIPLIIPLIGFTIVELDCMGLIDFVINVQNH